MVYISYVFFSPIVTPGQLNVKTSPEAAAVTFLNSKIKYYRGIYLDPGKYEVEVSAPGLRRPFRIGQRWLPGKGKPSYIPLIPLIDDKTRLYVKTVPKTDKIKIYQPAEPAARVFRGYGELYPGNYEIEVSAPGYESVKKELKVVAGIANRPDPIALEKIVLGSM